jgi:hypothetical protein
MDMWEEHATDLGMKMVFLLKHGEQGKRLSRLG